MDTLLLVAVAVLFVVALVDVWVSHLNRVAKVLWTLTILFLVGIGIVAWLLTRHSAYGPEEEAVMPVE